MSAPQLSPPSLPYPPRDLLRTALGPRAAAVALTVRAARPNQGPADDPRHRPKAAGVGGPYGAGIPPQAPRELGDLSPWALEPVPEAPVHYG